MIDAEWEKIIMDFWEKKPLVCSDELWNKFVEVKLENDLMEIVDDAIQYGIDLGCKQSNRDKEERIAELKNEIKNLCQSGAR